MTSARRLCWLGAFGIILAAGCSLFPLVSPSERIEREHATTPGAPNKHFLRVSQFVFLSDFELSRTQPLFRELSNLREQVFKDLQLPPSSVLIQVYLFE